jgi:hypothetical protein
MEASLFFEPHNSDWNYGPVSGAEPFEPEEARRNTIEGGDKGGRITDPIANAIPRSASGQNRACAMLDVFRKSKRFCSAHNHFLGSQQQ